MKKLLTFVLSLSLFLALPAFSDNDKLWTIKVMDKQLRTPLEGVNVSFDIHDQLSNKVTKHSCTSDVKGGCEFTIKLTTGFFADGMIEAKELKFVKDGYANDAEIKWFNLLEGKLLQVFMSSNEWLKKKREDSQREIDILVAAEQTIIDSKKKLISDALNVVMSQRNELIKQISIAEEKAKITCLTKVECDKVFSLTEIYIAQTSNMKIQLATATTIETFNPTEEFKIGLSAFKIPSKGTTSNVVIKVLCKEFDTNNSSTDTLNLMKATNICLGKRLAATEGFKPFIISLLKN